MVITNRTPLSFNEANAIAVPLKMRKGMKNNNKLFNPMLIVREARMKSSGKRSYVIKQNTSTANIRRIGSRKMRRIFFNFTLQYKHHCSVFDKEISKICQRDIKIKFFAIKFLHAFIPFYSVFERFFISISKTI